MGETTKLLQKTSCSQRRHNFFGGNKHLNYLQIDPTPMLNNPHSSTDDDKFQALVGLKFLQINDN